MSEPVIAALLQALVGCEWGPGNVRTLDDPEPCSAQAVQIVVVHHGEREAAFKLCAKHCDRVLAETTPHEDPASPSGPPSS